jgi:hypothetical protein
MWRLWYDKNDSFRPEGSELLRQCDARNRHAEAGGKQGGFMLFGLAQFADGFAAVRWQIKGASVQHTARAEGATMIAVFTVRAYEQPQSANARGYWGEVFPGGTCVALGMENTRRASEFSFEHIRTAPCSISRLGASHGFCWINRG